MDNKAVVLRPTSKKVLIIDDDDENARLLEALMRYAAGTVMVSLDPEEGLNYARWFKPDLILCDVDMPKMNGFELRRQLSEDPALGAIPFLFVSGHHSVSDQVTGLRLGAADYLLKPLQPETVLARAHFLLGKSPEDSQLSGRLELIPYPGLLQVLENNHSTGTLTLSGKARSGRIVFSEGRVLGASSGVYHGEDAAAALLWLNEGSFVFEPHVPDDSNHAFEDAPEGGWKAFELLMTASWLFDELKGLGSEGLRDDDLITIVDPVKALECFPAQKRWQQHVEDRETQPVSHIARMLHIGTFRCRVMLAPGLQSGALARVSQGREAVHKPAPANAV